MRSSHVTLAVVTVLALGACSSSDNAGPSAEQTEQKTPSATPSMGSSETPTERSTQRPATADVEVIDTDFRKPRITVDAGTKVRWTQIGDQPHSVSAADGSFDSSPKCGPLDSDLCLGEGDGFTHVFEKPGTYIYYCRVHGLPDGTGMVGEIVVR